MSRTVILVGRRSDGAHRDRLWRFCRLYWTRSFASWPLVTGYDRGPGPFSFSRAVNQAARRANGWTSCVYVGADWLPLDPDPVVRAAALAEETGKLVFPHNWTRRLDRAETARVLDGQPLHDAAADASAHPNTFSGVVALPRRLWEAVGGFDERFVGWGGEDISFWLACAAIGGDDRIDGTIVHLWHPQARDGNEDAPGYAANDRLMRRYFATRSSAAGMRDLLSEPGGPLA